MILDGKKLLDAERLQLSAKALVQTDGRLTFSSGAVKMLELPSPAEFDRDKPYTLLIYDLGDRNLGVVVKEGFDIRGFQLRRSGQEVYIFFKNYFREAEIDFSRPRSAYYTIVKTSEKSEDKSVYKFEFQTRALGEEEEYDDTPEKGGGQ